MEKEINYTKLGLKIKAIRQSKGLTQESLAEMVSCNTSHISNIENCHTKVSLYMLLAIDNEILRAIRGFENEKKEKLLKMIGIL